VAKKGTVESPDGVWRVNWSVSRFLGHIDYTVQNQDDGTLYTVVGGGGEWLLQNPQPGKTFIARQDDPDVQSVYDTLIRAWRAAAGDDPDFDKYLRDWLEQGKVSPSSDAP
jgi:hypothetical protein